MALDTDFWGPPIHTYSREQAIEDGVLVEVPAGIASDEGFRIPVVITVGVHAAIGSTHPDYLPRLRDVLAMARVYSRSKRQRGDASPTMFKVTIGRKNHWMTLHFSEYEGFTIMLPGED